MKEQPTFALMDPEGRKVVDLGLFKVTIKTLTPNQKRDVARTMNPYNDEDYGVILGTDYAKLPSVLEFGIDSIDRDTFPDGHSLKDKPVIDCLKWLKNAAMLHLGNELIDYCGLDEEEIKNSPCLSDQDSKASPSSVKMPVEQEVEPVSTTKKE
ncbi:hypothetical protein LCGC14_1281720 [marine sediment metagenome]|uniref:Uncharacterized protein n=1 Tax=marine sediment metagenome TaxID=412755 RepID=A0A0F9KV05_9ZZZZ